MTTRLVTKHKRYDKEYEELDYHWEDWKFVATSPKYPKFRAFAYVSRKEFALQESKRLARMQVNREYMEFLDDLGISHVETMKCGRCFQVLFTSKFEVYATGTLNSNCRKCANYITGERIKRKRKK